MRLMQQSSHALCAFTKRMYFLCISFQCDVFLSASYSCAFFVNLCFGSFGINAKSLCNHKMSILWCHLWHHWYHWHLWPGLLARGLIIETSYLAHKCTYAYVYKYQVNVIYIFSFLIELLLLPVWLIIEPSHYTQMCIDARDKYS